MFLQIFITKISGFRSIVCLIALLLISASIQAQTVINLDQAHIESIGKRSYFIEDPTGQLSLRDILSDSIQHQFQLSDQDAPNFSSTASAYWLKFEMEKKVVGNFYLEVGTAFMDSISLYELNEKGELVSSRYSGDDLPYRNREIKVSGYLFALDMPLHTRHTFYLRIKSAQPLFFPFRVGSLKSFMEFNHDQDYIQGIYFGFMLLIFLYNLFLYFMIKEKIYLFYIAYVFSITWFMASVYGYFFEYLWPNIPWINQEVVVSSGLTMVAATLFTQRFLDLKSLKPKLHYGSYFFLIAGGLVCLLVLFNWKITGLRLAQVGLLSMALYFLFLGIYFKINGHSSAKFYLIAWGALLTGIIFGLLESLNLIPVMPYLNAMQIGSAFEALLLSFALGDKINTYKQQKEEAMALALQSAQDNEKLIKEQNVILEQEVRKRTEEIAHQNEELISINEDKDNLISIVAHDLRSPLNQIKGLVQIVKLDANKLTEDSKEMLDRMHQSTDRLNQMISRILDVNAIEAKEINLKIAQVDLAGVVETVIKNFQVNAVEKSINLLFEYNENEEGGYFANVDENYLIQILENLISNALKFSDTKSNVFVRVIKDQSYINIEVEDNGPGISKEDQKNLFVRYKRLTAVPTAGESSTGLGLSIAKKYIEAMQGQILCSSALGKGTKFTVRFESI